MNGEPALSVDVCVCTYRRASLAGTLASLAALAVRPEWKVRVIVADNDETPTAQEVVENVRRLVPFPIVYVHAPARNISIARNACLDAATAMFVAFIDDDERASPEWLSALIKKQEQSGAEVVLGPVRSHYPDACAAWLKRGDFHSIKPVWVRGEIITGYTSNVLLVRETSALRGLRFDPKLGRSGGEDTLFFSAVHRAGGRIDYAPDAVVTEDVVSERLNFFWLMRRSFRSGQTHGLLLLVEQEVGWLPRLGNLALAVAKAAFCLVCALGNLLRCDRACYWILRGTMHAGVVARLFGVAELTQYG